MPKCYYCKAENSDANAECEFCGKNLRAPNCAAAGEAAPTPSRPISPMAQKLLDSMSFMNAAALLSTGKAFYSGVMQEKNFEAGYQFFYAAAIKGDAEAMFYVAKQLERGEGVACDPKKALWWYIQAAKGGSSEARMVLSELTNGAVSFEPEEAVCSKKTGLKGIIERVKPFCVEINAFSGEDDGASGTGCILSPEYILTNAHVVLDKNTKKPYKNISLRFCESVGNRKSHAITVIGYEPTEDIAVCCFKDGGKIEAGGFPKLRDAHTLTMGDEVFTIGNALGRGLALSTGVISREVVEESFGKAEVLQADMTINGGNSGGALFDMDGNVVGLMTFVACSSKGVEAQGMSYAITSNTISKMFERN